MQAWSTQSWNKNPTIMALSLLLILGAATWLQGQTNAEGTANQTITLKKGYDTILLGMKYEAAYQAIKDNPSVDYRGAPDVSLSPGREEKLIETRGGRYIQRGVFQFRQDVLFSIILELNPLQLDFYTLYTSLSAKYGEPKNFSPQLVLWEDSSTRLVLEKPLTLKYLDITAFNQIIKNSTIEASQLEQTRAAFIDKL